MSAYLLGYGFKADMGTPQRKLVLLKMIDACEEDGTRIFPAVETVARAAQCSTRHVQREIARFVEVRLLILVRQGGKGPRSTNEYALDLKVLRRIAEIGWAAYVEEFENDGSADAAGSVESESTGHENKGDWESPLAEADKGDTGDTERVTGATAKGDSRSRTTPPDPSIDPSTSARAREGVAGDDPVDRERTEDGPLGSLSSDQRKRLFAAWTHWDGRLGGSEDVLVREAVKLTAEEFERGVDTERIDAYRRIEKAQKLGHLKLYFAYLKNRKFDVEAIEANLAAEAPVVLPAWGKAWMAERLALLDRQEAVGRAAWRPTTYMQSQIAAGNGQMFDENRRRAQFPAVWKMDERAHTGQHHLLPPGKTPPPHEHFVHIAIDTDEWRAWADWHAARDWPWIDPPAHVRFVWVPSMLPDADAGAETEIERAGA